MKQKPKRQLLNFCASSSAFLSQNKQRHHASGTHTVVKDGITSVMDQQAGWALY